MHQWAPEQREEAVRHVRSSHGTVSAASRQLGVPPSTLRRWLREDRSARGDWISPLPASGTVAHPRMVKVLATFTTPRPPPPRPSLAGALAACVACVVLVGAVALVAASDAVVSGAAPRGFAAVALGAALGGLASGLPYRRAVDAVRARERRPKDPGPRPHWILQLERLARLRARRL